MQCTSDDCNEKATFHLTHVEDRKIVREQHLCENHARTQLTSAVTPLFSQSRTSETPEKLKRFDIDLLVICEVNEKQVVFLREVGGDRRIPILIGAVEATALVQKLKGDTSPRPLTHDAMAMIIQALGGEIENVVVDSLEQQAYHAKVAIRSGADLRIVDIRPSDAFWLAIAFGCPILFADDLIRRIFG